MADPGGTVVSRAGFGLFRRSERNGLRPGAAEGPRSGQGLDLLQGPGVRVPLPDERSGGARRIRASEPAFSEALQGRAGKRPGLWIRLRVGYWVRCRRAHGAQEAAVDEGLAWQQRSSKYEACRRPPR